MLPQYPAGPGFLGLSRPKQPYLEHLHHLGQGIPGPLGIVTVLGGRPQFRWGGVEEDVRETAVLTQPPEGRDEPPVVVGEEVLRQLIEATLPLDDHSVRPASQTVVSVLQRRDPYLDRHEFVFHAAVRPQPEGRGEQQRVLFAGVHKDFHDAG